MSLSPEDRLKLLDEHMRMVLSPAGFAGYREKNKLKSSYAPDEPLNYWLRHRTRIAAALPAELEGRALAAEAMKFIVSDLKQVHLGKLCARCGMHAERQCSRCRRARYCSVDCQRAHWPEHRGVCGPA